VPFWQDDIWEDYRNPHVTRRLTTPAKMWIHITHDLMQSVGGENSAEPVVICRKCGLWVKPTGYRLLLGHPCTDRCTPHNRRSIHRVREGKYPYARGEKDPKG
jgi:hypothetical protein